MTFFLTASGLMMERVRSSAMEQGSFLVTPSFEKISPL
jgi:hypothetical protein